MFYTCVAVLTYPVKYSTEKFTRNPVPIVCFADFHDDVKFGDFKMQFGQTVYVLSRKATP